MEKEKRIYKALELRADDGSKRNIIEGHAVIFNQPTVIGDSFIEVIDPKAFNGCDLSDVALFVNHDTSRLPLARTQSGTLTLKVDNIGLAIRATLDIENNPDAKALWHSIARGDTRGMSFCFTIADNGDEWQNLNSDMPTRIIKQFKMLYEVSCVTFPAYDSKDLQARSKQTLSNARKEKNRMTFEEFKIYMDKYNANRQNNYDPNDPDGRTAAVNARLKELQAEQPPEFIQGKGFIPAGENLNNFRQNEKVANLIQAGKDLKERREVESTFNVFGERRTMTVEPTDGAAASLIVPQYSSATITPNFPVVSSLVEAVAHLSLNGGESFSQPYITDIAQGGYTKEGQDYHEATTSFSYAPINRTKITAYAELTEELEKLPAAAYADIVFQNIRMSILKVLSREILFGEGVSDEQSRLVGIFSSKATAIESATDLSFSQITDTTLNEILYRYGGDETVESPSCLILSKLDLLAFANVRTSTKANFYDIEYNGNGVGGRINGVNFIVDSACKPLTSPDTQSGDFCMAYGNLSNYLLCEFSPLVVKRSDDYKFRKGIACFRGSVICGGNVTKHNGFIRVKKK